MAMNRELFKQIEGSYKTLCDERNPGQIVHVITEAIGLTDKKGRRYRDAKSGNHLLSEKREEGKALRRPEEFNLADLAEAMIGREYRQVLGLDRDRETIDISHIARFTEEAAVPIGPSVFANVAAWSSAVGGLMQAQFIDGYQSAPYDFVGLFPTRPTVFWQGGERYIDIIGAADPAPEVGIGAEHPDMPLSALWVEPGPMKKYGGKILVAKETAVIDISGGGILAKAKTGGETLAFRESELRLDIITGQTNNFRLGMLTDSGATGYNTYGPTIVTPAGVSQTIPNSFINPLNDVGAFQKSDENLAQLFHPVTGNPINVSMDVALLPTPLAKVGQWLAGVGELSAWNQTTSGPAQAAPGTFPNSVQNGKNPWQNVIKPIESRWLDVRHRASTTQTNPNRSAGLGLTGAAAYRWYRLDPSKFAARRVGWEPMNIDLNPGDYILAVQGIIAGQVFNVAVQYQVLSPWAIQRCLGA
jgi:hypothetical protein